MEVSLDFATWLKVIGMVATGLGSIVLAWRVTKILAAIIDNLVAHEVSIMGLREVLNGEPQQHPVVQGMTADVLEVQDKIGMVLFVVGLALIGIGMLASALSYFV